MGVASKDMIEHKRVATILVFNDENEFALQLRATYDDSFPSHWDFSASGGIDSGEEPDASAERELGEELGVKAPVVFLSEEHFTYPAWKPGVMREVDAFVYRARHNGPFTLDSNEVKEVRFLKLSEVKDMMESGEKFHPEFVLAWEKGIVAQAAN